MPTQMRPRRQQISQTLALSGRHPLKLEPRVDSPAFPQLRARRCRSRTDRECDTRLTAVGGYLQYRGCLRFVRGRLRGLTRLSGDGVVGIEKGARS